MRKRLESARRDSGIQAVPRRSREAGGPIFQELSGVRCTCKIFLKPESPAWGTDNPKISAAVAIQQLEKCLRAGAERPADDLEQREATLNDQLRHIEHDQATGGNFRPSG